MTASPSESPHIPFKITLTNSPQTYTPLLYLSSCWAMWVLMNRKSSKCLYDLYPCYPHLRPHTVKSWHHTAHTHTHTHTHTHKLTYASTRKHTYTHTQKHKHASMQTRQCTYACTHYRQARSQAARQHSQTHCYETNEVIHEKKSALHRSSTEKGMGRGGI